MNQRSRSANRYIDKVEDESDENASRNVGQIDSCRYRSISLNDEYSLVINAVFFAILPEVLIVSRRVFQ
jgi:hypothetical protein